MYYVLSVFLIILLYLIISNIRSKSNAAQHPTPNYTITPKTDSAVLNQQNDTRENISTRHIITADNLDAMIGAFKYQTATPMQWLIRTLEELREVLEYQPVKIIGKGRKPELLCKSDFSDFVLTYFDQFTLDEALRYSGASPWINHAERTSPDQRYRAIYPDGDEIAMGSPTFGPLFLYQENKKILTVSDCGCASFIWSDDSQFLAYSEWTKTRSQIIKILKIDGMVTKIIDQEKTVVQFISFDKGTLEFIDSPIYHPKKLSIDVSLFFD